MSSKQIVLQISLVIDGFSFDSFEVSKYGGMKKVTRVTSGGIWRALVIFYRVGVSGQCGDPQQCPLDTPSSADYS